MQTKKRNIVLEFNFPSKVFNKSFYDRLVNYSKFTEVYWGGASSGKSHGVLRKVVFKACQKWKKPRKILFTRKVGRSLKDSIFEDVKACLSDWGLLDKCKVNNTDFRITLPNGAEWNGNTFLDNFYKVFKITYCYLISTNCFASISR